ncbi:MAG: GNAT family N-acetyltransferase [Spirulina sp. SIO3F2]|nr:GNAT family N-acetyltransferase [Spirulina sp. SIO3F2]
MSDLRTFNPPLELTTDRLRLRQWQPSDRAPFAQLNADPQVMQFFPQVLDRAGSDALADRIERGIAERGWGLWAVELLQGGAFIGFVGLNIPPVNLPIAPGIEIGWRLALGFWGQGYATEAARAALRVGFTQLELPKIISFTALENRRSQAVMERLEMVRDQDTFMHPHVPLGSPLREHCLYRLSAERWHQDQ